MKASLRFFNLVLLGLLLLALSGCGDSNVVPEASAEEGEDAACVTNPNCIIVYTAQAESDYEKHLALFNRSHPDITVKVERDSTGIITDRILAEKDAPRADVIWAVATTSLLRAVAEGILEPYAPAGLTYEDGSFRVHPRARDLDDPPMLVGIDVFMSAFCVNTDLLAQYNLPMPTGWADLTNPVYEGHIVMPDPGSSGTGYIAVASYFHLFGTPHENRAWDYLNALDRNIVLYTRSGSAPCNMAGKGQVPIGISYGKKAVDLQADGAPVVPVFPVEGSGWELEANGLVRKNPTKDAAKIFLDWAISDEAMRSYATVFPLTSVETDVPLPPGYTQKGFGQLLQWRFIELAAKNQRIVEEWTARYGAKSERVGAELPDAIN
ncbi:MAG: putative 2-aminoethylphosphonate ABC transporter substrate-binding protein [Anaerolineae bacterium]